MHNFKNWSECNYRYMYEINIQNTNKQFRENDNII